MGSKLVDSTQQVQRAFRTCDVPGLRRAVRADELPTQSTSEGAMK